MPRAESGSRVMAPRPGIPAELSSLENPGTREPTGNAAKGILGKEVTRNSGISNVAFVEHNYPAVARMVQSDAFETAIGMLIILNSVTMGLGAEITLGRAEEWKGFVSACEHVFTLCFVVEFMLRVFVCGWRTFVPFIGDMWFFLDAVLVFVTGVLTVWILPLFQIANSGVLRTISVLRVCRLVRLVRVVAKVKMFHEVWQLIRGLTESMRTLFWTIIVISCITYVFYCLCCCSDQLRAPGSP